MTDKILVVEEEKELRGFYQTELQEDGYCVKTAAGGREALNKLHDETVDLVVLDPELSDGSGLDYLQDIVDFNRNIKVVITTDNPSYKLDFHTWLADALLIKSSNSSELKGAIDTLLHSKRK